MLFDRVENLVCTKIGRRDPIDQVRKTIGKHGQSFLHISSPSNIWSQVLVRRVVDGENGHHHVGVAVGLRLVGVVELEVHTRLRGQFVVDGP